MNVIWCCELPCVGRRAYTRRPHCFARSLYSHWKESRSHGDGFQTSLMKRVSFGIHTQLRFFSSLVFDTVATPLYQLGILPSKLVSGAASRQLVAPHGWGNPAGRVDTPASPALPLEGAGRTPKQIHAPSDRPPVDSPSMQQGSAEGGSSAEDKTTTLMQMSIDVPEQLKAAFGKWWWKRHLAVYGFHALTKLWHQELGRGAWAVRVPLSLSHTHEHIPPVALTLTPSL